jgi:hypothetical protein
MRFNEINDKEDQELAAMIELMSKQMSDSEIKDYLKNNDMKNPLPYITADDSQNVWDAINNTDDEVSDVGGQAVPMDVPINKIVCIEPRLNSAYVKAIQSGKVTKTDLPVFYFYNSKYYASDGNHRIVAAYLNKQPTIRGDVYDAHYWDSWQSDEDKEASRQRLR